MSKVALAICGGIRNHKTLDTIHRIFDKHDTDVFIHVWKDIPMEQSFLKLFPYEQPTEKTIARYKPKRYIIESWEENKAKYHEGLLNLGHMIGQYSSLKNVWDLMKDVVLDYDFVFRMRFEMTFNTDPTQFNTPGWNVPINPDSDGLCDWCGWYVNDHQDDARAIKELAAWFDLYSKFARLEKVPINHGPEPELLYSMQEDNVRLNRNRFQFGYR